MSLYHEAADVLDRARNGGGSLKSIVFGVKSFKSDPKTLFALSAEAAKWSAVLSEVVEESGLLKDEKQLSPTLALLLVHDLLLSKRGIALPATHGLNTAITRHKSRLSAELTKARIRRGFTNLADLRASIIAHSSTGSRSPVYPRWIRINTLWTTLDQQLQSTFAGYETRADLTAVADAAHGAKTIWIDKNVPNLVAIPSHVEITATKAYKSGELILQDKASCFPACLLNITSSDRDAIDTCAAPGNKTTHLAALKIQTARSSTLNEQQSRIYACEKNAVRAQTLARMVKLAKADSIVDCLQKQDFLRLDPTAGKFSNVTALLLDPSCSGSGIVGRDDGTVTIHLPTLAVEQLKGKKRKRATKTSATDSKKISIDASAEQETAEQEDDDRDADADKLYERLSSLSAFQLRIIEHAMRFPAARKITYSTCSIHDEENEAVIVKALLSDVSKTRGWKVMTRDVQVSGMRDWPRRGGVDAVRTALAAGKESGVETGGYDPRTIADACIRCHKNTKEMTMGFFVAGFVRDEDQPNAEVISQATGLHEEADDGKPNGESHGESIEDSDDEWNGFGDDDN